ncbi:hypothetical protein AVEN_102884-1 [Araneus ventricosus]|uniref:Uncharacterized protein n=1 Tax=Araneus ventricosus TaxID=182803 RepID=A0A4Y2LYF7_ARAVE|nr:hypothetical protein AVEN_102884-1 [Araneus ventricosus]
MIHCPYFNWLTRQQAIRNPLLFRIQNHTHLGAPESYWPIPPLYLQLQQEAELTAIRRLHLFSTLWQSSTWRFQKGKGWAVTSSRLSDRRTISLEAMEGSTYREPASTRKASKTEKVGREVAYFASGQEQNIDWRDDWQNYKITKYSFPGGTSPHEHTRDHATSLLHQLYHSAIRRVSKRQPTQDDRKSSWRYPSAKSLLSNKHLQHSLDQGTLATATRLTKESAESDERPIYLLRPRYPS